MKIIRASADSLLGVFDETMRILRVPSDLFAALQRVQWRVHDLMYAKDTENAVPQLTPSFSSQWESEVGLEKLPRCARLPTTLLC
jgi:hypothetical protein